MGRLRSTFWRLIFRSRAAKIEREIDDELRLHIELRIDDNLARGMNRREARNEAFQRFGPLRATYRECRSLRLNGVVRPERRRLVDAFLHDMRHGLRLLARSPVMSCVAILSLALGISSATIIYSVAHEMLFRSLPYPEADRLVTLSDSNAEYGRARSRLSGVEFSNWRQQEHIFELFAGFVEDTREVTGIGEPEMVPVQFVSAGLLELLGIEPALGRAFTAGEHSLGGDLVVVVSHDFWRERLSARPEVLGETLLVGSQPHVIVGVLPAGAELLSPDGTSTVHRRGSALLLALESAELPRYGVPLLRVNDSYSHFLRGIGRLAAGLSFDDALREAEATSRKLEESFPHGPALISAAQTIYMVPLRDDLYESFELPLRVAGWATLVVLLIACANVGGLLAGRIARREPELAARAALGAGRGRLVYQLVAESAALVVPGLAVAIVFTWWGARLLDRLVPPTFFDPFGGGVDLLPTLAPEAVINAGSLSFAAALTVATVFAFGLLPALAVGRRDLAARITGAARVSTGRWSGWSRHAFVVAQIALSLAMLIGAGLLINTYWRYARVELGLDAERVLVLEVSLADRYFEPVPASAELTEETGVPTVPGPTASAAQFLEESVERLEALPGVESASAWLGSGRGPVGIRGRPTPDDPDEQRALFRAAFGDVFSTLGIELRAGSLERLVAGEAGTAAINQAFADRYVPGEDPIGQVLEFPGSRPDHEIVAVLADDRYSHDLNREVGPTVTMLGTDGRFLHFLVRTHGDPLAIAQAAQREIWSVDENQAIQTVRRLEELVYESVARERIFAQLLGFFAFVGLFLALLGIYGVINLFVALSTREIGLRIALGAQPGNVLRLVVGRALLLTLAGIAIGLTVAFATTRYLESLLYEISPTDSTTYVVLTILFAIAALAASYLPALRATRIDPVDALRVD